MSTFDRVRILLMALLTGGAVYRYVLTQDAGWAGVATVIALLTIASIVTWNA